MPEQTLYEYRAREKRAHKLAKALVDALIKGLQLPEHAASWQNATHNAGLEREPSVETKRRTLEILKAMRPIASAEEWSQ